MPPVVKIFISYASEDSAIADRLASELGSAGFPSWYYGRDSLPGVSYLIQTGRAIEECTTFILLISKASINSHQVSREVERAHECGKSFLPVLIDMTHAEFIKAQPMWRQAIGTQTSIEVPRSEVSSIIPRLVEGLKLIYSHDQGPLPEQWSKNIVSLLKQPRIFTFGYRPSVKGIIGRDMAARKFVQQFNGATLEFLSLYGAGGIGKSCFAAVIFSLLGENGACRFGRFIWCDLRAESNPENVLLQLVNFVTDGNIPFGGAEEYDFNRLLDLFRARTASSPTFFVFDNLDIGFEAGGEAGSFSSDRWLEMFRAFVGTGCAIMTTSRQVPRFHDPYVEFHPVGGLPRKESIELLRKAGLKDSEKVLVEAHTLLQGHPMALTALAAMVMRRPSYAGRLTNAGDIMDSVRNCPDRTRNPVVLFEELITPERLKPEEYSLLTAMSVLLRPEAAETIRVLRPEIKKAEIPIILDGLYLRSLVQAHTDADPPTYSLHPLVREVARTRLDDAETLHERLYKYYTSIPLDKGAKDPESIEHLRFAVLHALATKNLEAAKAVLYGERNLSGLFDAWGRLNLALSLHQNELAVAEEVGNDADTMRAAGFLAKCLCATSRYKEALEYATRALEIASQLKDQVGEGRYKFYIGITHLRTGNFDEALKWFEQALEIACSIGDERREGRIRRFTGEILSVRGEYDKAIEWLGDALNIAIKLNDPIELIESSAAIGNIHFLRSDYSKAVEVLAPAVDMASKLGSKSHESLLNILMGRIYMEKGDYRHAIERFEPALEFCIEIGDRRREGGLKGLIAKILSIRGEYDKALELFQDALHISVDIGSRAGEAYRRGQIGEVHLALGDLDSAEKYLMSALEFAIQSGNKPNECVWQGRMGEVCLERGDCDKALVWLQKAYEIAAEMKDTENQCDWGGVIGRVYLEMGQYDKAQEWLERALSISLEISHPVHERCQHLNLGKLYLKLNLPQDALPHFERALEIAKELGMSQGIVEESQKWVEEATELFDKP